MNSFFASVEQQLDPALRGQSPGITAVEEKVDICVAASYEASACGVKTGIPVVEAKKLCPSALHSLDPCHARTIRHSVERARFVRLLQGRAFRCWQRSTAVMATPRCRRSGAPSNAP